MNLRPFDRLTAQTIVEKLDRNAITLAEAHKAMQASLRDIPRPRTKAATIKALCAALKD